MDECIRLRIQEKQIPKKTSTNTGSPKKRNTWSGDNSLPGTTVGEIELDGEAYVAVVEVTLEIGVGEDDILKGYYYGWVKDLDEHWEYI